MYNYNELMKMIKEVKDFNITVTGAKKYHFPKYLELKNLYEMLGKINNGIFWDGEYHIKQYRRSIEMNDTKKEMDKYLKLCKKYMLEMLHNFLEYTA